MQQFMQEYSLQEISSACISLIKTIVLLLPIYIFPVILFSTVFAYAKHLNTHCAKRPYQSVSLAKFTRTFLLPSDDSKQQ